MNTNKITFIRKSLNSFKSQHRCESVAISIVSEIDNQIGNAIIVSAIKSKETPLSIHSATTS